MIFDPAQLSDILERLSSGESLRSCCRTPGYPTMPALLRHVTKDDAFRARYVEARKIGWECLAEELIDVASNREEGVEVELEEGGPSGSKTKTKRFDAVQSRRLRTDVIKWTLARLHPEKWGDKVELSGSKTAPIVIQVTESDVGVL